MQIIVYILCFIIFADFAALFFDALAKLPSASTVASSPKDYNNARSKVSNAGGEILNYRPHDTHGPPMTIMSEAFSQFCDEAASCVPSVRACEAARDLVSHVSQVNEVK